MKSFMASPATIKRDWYVVDAEGQTLGRLASEIAKVLRGKNKPIYTPHMDCGDYVIVVNAEKIKVTGKKLDQKIYYHHSEYIGGMKEILGENNEFGVVTENDDESLYSAIRHFLTDESFCDKYRQQARECSVDFDRDMAVTKVEDLLLSL